MADFLEELKRATSSLEGSEAEDLRGVLTTAWTSSSEMWGEIGLAIRRVEAANRELPADVRSAFAGAMAEIHKVWPLL